MCMCAQIKDVFECAHGGHCCWLLFFIGHSPWVLKGHLSLWQGAYLIGQTVAPGIFYSLPLQLWDKSVHHHAPAFSTIILCYWKEVCFTQCILIRVFFLLLLSVLPTFPPVNNPKIKQKQINQNRKKEEKELKTKHKREYITYFSFWVWVIQDSVFYFHPFACKIQDVIVFFFFTSE